MFAVWFIRYLVVKEKERRPGPEAIVAHAVTILHNNTHKHTTTTTIVIKCGGGYNIYGTSVHISKR